jgi:DNA mismatch repair protein MutL
VGLKQEGVYFWNTDFSFESEVTGSLFNEEEVEQTVNNAYQIHKNIVSPIRNGYCGSAAGIKECCMSSFD